LSFAIGTLLFDIVDFRLDSSNERLILWADLFIANPQEATKDRAYG
jgi:hypothetical protein